MSIHVQIIPASDVTTVTTLDANRQSRLYICCDTEAERPDPTGLKEGDLAFMHDTGKIWLSKNNQWSVVGGGGGTAELHQTFFALVTPLTL